ncbi:MAG: 3-phosphoshikimate 1-carboxyvinyltransferase [Acidimicrobiales bacterium]
MTVVAVRPLAAPPDVTVAVPGSKSITNRALVVAALAAGRSELTGVLFSDDTEAMLTSLQGLGLAAEADPAAATVTVDGWDGLVPPGPPAGVTTVDVRQAGTAARFLPPLLALGLGHYVVDGAPQMRGRPMAGLVGALRDLGVDVLGDGLPLEIVASGAVAGGPVTVPAGTSSQFLSGLLLSAPYFRHGLQVHAEGHAVSRPYVAMTAATMAAFGVDVEVGDGGRRFTVRPGQRYRGARYAVEPDASAASYFLAAAAITGGRVRVEGLGRRSVQGDLRFVDVLARMGAAVKKEDGYTEVVGGPLHGVEVDLADFSDTAPTLAVTAAFATTPTRIGGIGFIRAKESDRIGNVVAELRRCGIHAEEEPDGMVVHPGAPKPAVVQTYDDHRMAMAFSLLGLVADGIVIAGPDCVRKTFPDFFATLDRLRS